MRQLVHSDPVDRIVYARSLRNGDVGRVRARLTHVVHNGTGHSIMSGRMRIAMRNPVPFRATVNFWRLGVCFLAVVIWLALPTSVSSGTSPEATPQVQPVASGTSSSPSQNPLLKVLKIVATPRWLDYRFRFEAVTVDTIIVSGKGSTYDDQPRRFQFSWNPDD